MSQQHPVQYAAKWTRIVCVALAVTFISAQLLILHGVDEYQCTVSATYTYYIMGVHLLLLLTCHICTVQTKYTSLKYEAMLRLDDSGCYQGRPPPPTTTTLSPPLLSSFSLRLLPLPLFNEGQGVSPRENFGIKDVCRYVLENFDGLIETKR